MSVLVRAEDAPATSRNIEIAESLVVREQSCALSGVNRSSAFVAMHPFIPPQLVAPRISNLRSGISLRSQPTRNARPLVFRARLLLGRRRKLTVPPEVGAGAETAVPEAVLAGAGPTEGRSLGQIAWMRLKRDKVALAGGAFLIFLILVAIFAPLIVKYLGHPPNEFHQELIDTAGGTLAPIGRFGGMSWDHLMGIEPVNGRDIFSRIVYGSRISLLIAFLATLLSVAIGTTLGIISGFIGGWTDTFTSRLMDVFLAFPLLVLAIALAGVFPDQAFGLEGNQLRIALLIFIIGFFNWPYIGRIIRGPDALAPRAGVRRVGQKHWGPPRLHPAHRDAAQPHCADPGLLDAADPHQHPLRGGAVLPRRRYPPAHPELGRNAVRRRRLLHAAALHVLAWHGDLRHGLGLQPVRRRAARRPRSTSQPIGITIGVTPDNQEGIQE